MSACDCPTCGQPLPPAEARYEASAGIVLRQGRYAELSDLQAELYGLLVQRKAHVVTRGQIMDALYGLRADDPPEEKIVDVEICKIRKKLAPLGIEIKTVWGRGYRLIEEVSP